MSLAPYNDYWRMIRKLCSSELFLHKRINASAPARQNCIDVMIQRIKDDSLASRVNGESGEIALDKYLCLMTFNLIANFMLSRDIMDLKSEKGNEFYEAMKGFMEWSGKPNLVDSFPFLKWIDPQGIRGNTGKSLTKLLNMVSGFLKERVQEKLSGKVNETKDFLDVLLERIDDGKGTLDELSEKNVTIIVLEMFFGGTETTSGTIHWGISELIRNPKSLKKLQNELDQVIGRSRKVEENDLNKLPYLQAVVKEILRLHPSLPLLLPRKAVKDTEFMGYSIPKDTTVILNAWAIHRDPKLWDEPLMFKPERFIDSKIDSKGQNFEFLPFGSGRRSCVGMFLGDRMVSITLARLIQSFDWELPRNVSPDSIDMREQMGISLRKLVPLIAIPFERHA
ncbi:hypothetical protein RD792_008251 [Penstemon davidsonii]|uniref:Cytochrome P450 n=1 Tax=Penstemon davidsonii TaxID=160366 RepID=A0ABR0D9Y5_9LAMI|nr:hypothetical protein RD792_008251 [Penstemon davidsonii]